MPKMKTLTANSAESLHSALRKVDISVPPRTEGRKTSHTEIWTICHLLSTMARDGELQFPLTVEHRDKPDFLIQANSKNIGVEVTESIPTTWAHFSALAAQQAPEVIKEPAHFGRNAPNLTNEEMQELLSQKKLTAPGWVGEQPEKEWASFIFETVELKLEKLTRGDFDKFEENWLSVYENLPLADVYLSKAVKNLKPLLNELWSRTPRFHRVFVQCGTNVIKLSENSEHIIPLVDLWN